MFTERLNRLLTEVCRTTTGEFAKSAKYDRSYIAHLRNGDRIPRPDRKAAVRLSRALCNCAYEKGAEEELRELIGASRSLTEEELCSALHAWLYEGQEGLILSASGKTVRPLERGLRGSFGRRLSSAMELANISNLRLSRMLNVDVSVIGKYRSGLRVPRVNHPLIREISFVLAARICSLERTAGLSRLIGVPQEELSGEDECARRLEIWLRDFSALDTSLIESFLDDVDSVSMETPAPVLSPEEAAGGALTETDLVYTGVEGLRRAVLRFLGSAVLEGKKQLLLYSDQSMDWLTQDPDFMLRWSSLMGAFVRGGGRIRMIHHMERGLEEMLAAIRSWMPLYLSGRIESWYCRRRGGERFSHTLFLEPEGACVSACYICGREANAHYRYSTDKTELDFFRTLYEDLFSECRPLIRLEETGCLPVPRGPEYHIVDSTLSLATMPEGLLESIMDRAKLTDALRREILSEWRARREALEQTLSDGRVHECVPLPAEETLFAGAVPVDTCAARLYYTPEEYARHIRGLLSLSEAHASYHFYPLSEPPFQHIRLMVSERLSCFGRSGEHAITSTTTHPLLCRAAVNFAERLEGQYDLDRLTLRETLKRFI